MPFQHSLRAALSTSVTCTCVGRHRGLLGVTQAEMVPVSPSRSGLVGDEKSAVGVRVFQVLFGKSRRVAHIRSAGAVIVPPP